MIFLSRELHAKMCVCFACVFFWRKRDVFSVHILLSLSCKLQALKVLTKACRKEHPLCAKRLHNRPADACTCSDVRLCACMESQSHTFLHV